MADDCFFCKIASGEVEVPLVYEDDYVLAFDDIRPQAPVHTLVIPRIHVSCLNEAEHTCPEVVGPLFLAAAKVARLKGLVEQGYRIIQNNGADAGQTVFHLHVHILGGRPLSEGLV